MEFHYRCGSFSLYDPNCAKWERDYSKPYPDCCTNFICTEYVKNKINSQEIDKNTLE